MPLYGVSSKRSVYGIDLPRSFTSKSTSARCSSRRTSFDATPYKGIKWQLVRSSFIKENSGNWNLRAEGDAKTHATYTLEVKVSFLIPKFVSTGLAGSELPKVLEAFKKRAEG